MSANITQKQLCDLFQGNVVVGAFLPTVASMFIAAKVSAGFSASPRGKDHPCIAASANQQATKGVVRIRPCGWLLDLNAPLHCVEGFLIDKGLVCIFYCNPFIFRPWYNSLVFEGFRFVPLTDQLSKVNGVAQNLTNRCFGPRIRMFYPFISMVLSKRIHQVSPRSWNFFALQCFGNVKTGCTL